MFVLVFFAYPCIRSCCRWTWRCPWWPPSSACCRCRLAETNEGRGGGTTCCFVQISTTQNEKNKTKQKQEVPNGRVQNSPKEPYSYGETETWPACRDTQTQNDFRGATLTHDTNHNKRPAGVRRQVQGSSFRVQRDVRSGSRCVNEWVSDDHSPWHQACATAWVFSWRSHVRPFSPETHTTAAWHACVWVWVLFLQRKQRKAKQRRDNSTATKLFIEMTRRTLKKMDEISLFYS